MGETRFARHDLTSAFLYLRDTAGAWRKLSISLNEITQAINEFGRCDIELSGTVHEVEEHISCTPEEDWERMILNGIHNENK